MRHLADGCKTDADTEFDADKSATQIIKDHQMLPGQTTYQDAIDAD